VDSNHPPQTAQMIRMANQVPIQVGALTRPASVVRGYKTTPAIRRIKPIPFTQYDLTGPFCSLTPLQTAEYDGLPRETARNLAYSKFKFMSKQTYRRALALLWALSLPSVATAQGLETLGNRASALAAFVAVADDASAVAWNPAGLVSGPIFNITLGLGRTTDASDTPLAPGRRAGQLGTTLIALGSTPVGVAYYRLSSRSIQVDTPAVLGSPDRETRQAIARTLVTSHLGATVQQSVGDYLTLGATLKLVRGSVGRAVVAGSSWDEALGEAEAIEGLGSTRGDLDVGAMLAVGRVRAGLVVRNLTAPTFGEENGVRESVRVTLERHVRIGAAWADRWPGISRTVLSIDADLTRVPHPAGERRDVAVGMERWVRGQQVGLRAGVRASTVGGGRPVLSLGGSFAVRAGTFVDGYVAKGTRDDRGWGLAVRLSY